MCATQTAALPATAFYHQRHLVASSALVSTTSTVDALLPLGRSEDDGTEEGEGSQGATATSGSVSMSMSDGAMTARGETACC